MNYNTNKVEELNYILHTNEVQEKKNKMAKEKALYEAKLYERDSRELYNMVNNRVDYTRQYEKFRKDVTDSFVTEAILCINNSCLNKYTLEDEYNNQLARQLVTNFVQEEGSQNLLNRFKRTSYLLSEVAYVCEQHINLVLEKADKKNPDTMKIDNEDKKSFYNRLDTIDSDNSISAIRNRVMDATQDFIDSNTLDKMKIKDILQDTKEKIEKSREKKNAKQIQESYAYSSKRDIQEIRSNKTKNIFEAMVYTLAESSMINESANEIYVKNSALDMDKIVEHCEIMYNFLATIDTTKMKNVDESYIKTMLKDLKG